MLKLFMRLRYARLALSAILGLSVLPTPLVHAYGWQHWIVHEGARAGLHRARYSRAPAAVSPEMTVTQGTPNSACPQFQSYGYPETHDPKLQRRAFYTCRAGYAGMFDPATRTPLWVAEHLVRGQLNGGAKRKGLEFREDPQIPYPAQAHASDYAHSCQDPSHICYDKGHMAPAADFRSSAGGMEETFEYSNAVPQEASHNRGIWANLEGSVRESAERRGELYVITGPIFAGEPIRLSHGRRVTGKDGVVIPSALYKVLVDPRTREMTAFIIPNESGQGEDPARFQVDVRSVERATGLNFNPTLSRADADRLEVGGGHWLLPRVRIRFRD